MSWPANQFKQICDTTGRYSGYSCNITRTLRTVEAVCIVMEVVHGHSSRGLTTTVLHRDLNRGLATGSSAETGTLSPLDLHVFWFILVLATMFQSQLVVPMW